MKRTLGIIVAVVVLVLAGMWWFSDRQVLGRRMEGLMEVMTFNGGANVRVMDALSFSRMMGNEVMLDLPQRPERTGEFSRDEMEEAYLSLRRNAKSSRFELVAIEAMEIRDGRALVRARVEAMLEMPGIRLLDGEYPVDFTWTDGADGWRLSGLRWEEKL